MPLLAPSRTNGNKRSDYLTDFFRAAPSIWLRCKGCRHVGQVEVAELAQRYTMNTPTRTLLSLFNCAECGRREFDWCPRTRD